MKSVASVVANVPFIVGVTSCTVIQIAVSSMAESYKVDLMCAHYMCPTIGSSPGVVFIHGLKSTMNGQKAIALESFCQRRGTAFVRFELSGHGDSSLDFKDCNITMWLEDLNAVLSSLTEGPQVLVGSSIGGWLMFLYTMRNPERITGLLGVSTAPDLTQSLWEGLDKATKSEVRKKGVYHMKSPYNDEPYDISLELIQDGDKYSVLDMPGKGP